MENTTENAPATPTLNLFDLQHVEVTVTYPMLGEVPPMKFYLRPLLDAEEKQLRQDYFGLKDAERENAKHAHNVEMLSRLATRAPENVPTFPTPYNPENNLRLTLKDFFSGDNAMKKKLADDVLTIYFDRTQPREFFRSF